MIWWEFLRLWYRIRAYHENELDSPETTDNLFGSIICSRVVVTIRLVKHLPHISWYCGSSVYFSGVNEARLECYGTYCWFNINRRVCAKPKYTSMLRQTTCRHPTHRRYVIHVNSVQSPFIEKHEQMWSHSVQGRDNIMIALNPKCWFPFTSHRNTMSIFQAPLEYTRM